MTTKTQVKKLGCKCALCGEELTCPIEYKGLVYGYSCIKKVNPNYKKQKDKTYWVEADNFTIELLDNGRTRVKASYVGNHYDKRSRTFVDFHDSFNFSKSILVQDGKAFINLYAYKNGVFHI